MWAPIDSNETIEDGNNQEWDQLYHALNADYLALGISCNTGRLNKIHTCLDSFLHAGQAILKTQTLAW